MASNQRNRKTYIIVIFANIFSVLSFMVSIKHRELEYLLLLPLPKEVQQHVMYFKNVFKDTYDFPNALITYPHLTLLKFMQFENYEGAIINKLIQLACYVSPFQVILNGFRFFERVFYIDVATGSAILDIVYNQRSSLLPLLRAGKNRYHFTRNAHVTIARGLLQLQCLEISRSWKIPSYQAAFIASQMLLLKRTTAYSPYKPVNTIRFIGNKSYPKQGDLF